jgi:membrane-associated phospholipid phosphatase
MRETGLLGGVAMVDALVVDEVVKLCTFRERPYVDNGEGQFFRGSAGVDSSFISGHSMIAWSSAAVMAGEYNKPWQQVAIYSGAAGVSLTRVMAQQHFPTDVLLGSAGGWLIGHYVFRAHHHRDRDVADLQH